MKLRLVLSNFEAKQTFLLYCGTGTCFELFSGKSEQNKKQI